jgi:hypothetical protein
MAMLHDWKRDEDERWRCSVCKERSPDRRKPARAGCGGPVYTDAQLERYRLRTRRPPNKGLALTLVGPDMVAHSVAFFGPGFEHFACLIEQYINWLNRELEGDGG